MTTSQLVVTLLGIVAIAWVNFYFFVAGRDAEAEAARDGSGPQRVPIHAMGDHEHDAGKDPAES